MLSKNIKSLSFTFLLFLNVLSVQSQTIKKFSIDKEKFLVELESMFNEVNADLADNLMSEFKMVWDLGPMDPKKQEKLIAKANKSYQARMLYLKVNSNYTYGFATKRLNDFQMKEIIIISNKMLSKRMKASPDFDSYINAVLSFMLSGQEEKSFDAWSKSCKKLIDEGTRKYKSYIKKCNDLFLLNSIHESASTKWMARDHEYYFDYDSLPKVVFNKVTLTCLSKGDSAVIFNTKGVFYPTQTTFYGELGNVYWDRAGLGRDTCWAELDDYSLRLNTSSYSVDSVTYYNTKYFSGPLRGRLEEKVQANVTVAKANYPKFRSFDKKVFLENIFKNIDYEGGFAVKGARFIGAGSEEDLASVYIKRNDTVLLKGQSKAFVIRDDRIQSAISNVTIYLDNDSIFHPSISFKFLSDIRELTLFRSEKGISASPFFNSYHELDMYIEWLKWKIDEPKMEMSALIGSDVGRGFFESSNYYDESKFLELQGIDNVHPLIKVRDYVKNENGGDREFYDSDFRGFVKLPMDQVERMLIRMNNLGFLMYDISRGTVKVKQRCFDYILAKSAKADYDAIIFNSTVKNRTNADLSLLNYDLTIFGVKKVTLSTVQKTFVYPSEQTVVVHKNRDFSFGGAMESGKLQYFGKNFEFYYDEFKVDMQATDSIRIVARAVKFVEKGKNKGKKIFQHGEEEEAKWGLVKNVLENINGVLEIDYPFNKSGLKKDSFPDFPIYTTDNKCYVYYDRTNIQGGVYDRNKVHFQIYPFTFDSLNHFDERAMSFDGKFSSGIFPDFEEKLTIMDDHSLGFLRKAPAGGFPMYGDKATFVNDIKLSSKGLQGDGNLDYLTSTTVSKAFTFFPDSVNALAETFDLKEVKKGASVEFPQSRGEQVNMHWEPYKDRMDVSSIEQPIEMYNGEAMLHGTLMLTPKELQGKGKMEFVEAELDSDLFNYKNMEFKADTSDFRLKANDEDSEAVGGLAFKTSNVNSYINFEERIGEFVANDGASYVDFPVNQYICFMDKFKWFMDKAELELSSTENSTVSNEEGAGGDDLDLAGSEFISTHGGQDSLKFISPSANYDLKKYVIKAHDVKFINVADAKIYPGDGEVVVEKKAKMQQLKEAKIIANNTTKYHEMINANVDILARRDYLAEADYEYVDEAGSKQIIHFAEIKVDTVYQTVGTAQIAQQDYFKLSSAFEFKGSVDLFANEKFLNYKGTTRLTHDCKMTKPWIYFENYIDPKKVLIPVDTNAVDENKVKLVNGLMMKKDSTHIYSAMMNYRKFHSDYHIAPAQGFLMYDAESKSYRLSNKDKLAESSFPGNLVELRTKTCELYAEGKFELSSKIGQMKIDVAGNGLQNNVDHSTSFEFLMAFDFIIDDAMWKDVLSNLEGNTNLTQVDLSREVYRKGLTEMLGKEEGDKAIADLNLYGAFKKFPKEFSQHAVMFNDVKMIWDQDMRSYRSDGSLGIQSIGKSQINKYTKGWIEINKKRSGDVVNLYIEIDDNTWYFFTYARGIMQVLSSSEVFNNTVLGLKDDKRTFKSDEKGVMQYQYMLSTKRKKSTFVARMEQ